MTEYLFYVSLVFIPIACWIAYLLYQDGFDIVTTVLVLALSYLMITAFPFSIQHLGTGVTIMVYGVMLTILIMIISKPELFNFSRRRDDLSPELAGESCLTVAGGETTIFPLSVPAAKSQQPDVQFQVDVANNSSLPDDVADWRGEIPANAINDFPVELVYSNNVADTNLLLESSAQSDDEVTGLSGDDLSVDMIPAEVEPVMVIEGDDSSSLDELDKEVLADNYREETLPTDNITLPSQDVVESTGAVVFAQESASASIEKATIMPEPDAWLEEVNLVQEQESAVIDHSNSSPIERDDHQPDWPKETVPVIIADDAAAGKSADSTDLVDWIELGFEAKSQGDLGLAVDNFTRALRSTDDNELKHLLGMELVGILQSMGDYERAEIVLDDLIQNIDSQPDVVTELHQQRQYNNLLADELARLGIADTPIFEVPRFVRIKVREKMLA